MHVPAACPVTTRCTQGLSRCLWHLVLLAVAVAVVCFGPIRAAPLMLDAVVSTLAGTAGQVGSVDGTGRDARFYGPTGMCIDRSGIIYVADSYNHTIRTIDPGGVVRTLAGQPGIYGYADGPAAQARFAFPHGVAVDAAGNVYVAEVHNRLIRKIDSQGIVTTLAGGPGMVGHVDGPGSQARFGQPEGIATDAGGNVYVADAGNGAIRKITPDGMVSTLASNIASPEGIAIDAVGNLYVAAAGDSTVRKITSSGEVSLVAGLSGNSGSADGYGSAALFHEPFGVALDAVGNIYVADSFNHTIRVIAADGMVTTLAGHVRQIGFVDGRAVDTYFALPWGIVIDRAGQILVADYFNHAIRLIATVGPAVEYYHPAYGHYFLTASRSEVEALDAGQFAGWSRTGQSFSVLAPTADAARVCRFWSGQTYAPKSSHFYTPYADECAKVKQDPVWQFEGHAFALRLPEAGLGYVTCPSDTRPLYRAYNRGMSGAPNHRYTTDPAVLGEMVAQGWQVEGDLWTRIFACVPAQE